MAILDYFTSATNPLCPRCGHPMVLEGYYFYTWRYRCPRCGYQMVLQIDVKGVKGGSREREI